MNCFIRFREDQPGKINLKNINPERYCTAGYSCPGHGRESEREEMAMTNDKSQILVVDDDVDIADIVEIYLTGAGFTVFKAHSAAEGLKLIEENEISLAILDVMMPDMDGLTMCKIIRQKHNFPIMMLSAMTSETDKIRGLNMGADDYITKPFSAMELLARVRSHLRRYYELNEQPEKEKEKEMIRLSSLTMDLARHQVTVDGREVSLTPIEFDILQLLASHPGRVYKTEEIYEYVWNEKIYESYNTVMVHIRRLREKIEANPRKPMIIKTVWGVGYKIDD